jgi:DNA-binding XRE family transcriptional regulator
MKTPNAMIADQPVHLRVVEMKQLCVNQVQAGKLLGVSRWTIRCWEAKGWLEKTARGKITMRSIERAASK